MEPQRFVPSPDGRNRDFYQHLATGRLHLQQCAGCARVLHPPRYSGPGCGSDDLAFVASAGRGRLFSWTVTHRPVDPGWAARVPYATVVVAMDEGVRLVGGWRGANEALALDLPVTVEVEPVSVEFAFLWFRPAAQEE